MLVPQGATAPTLTGKAVGPNIALSFQTQNGFNYTVLYKNQLSDPTWSTLTSVSGDGTVKTVNDPHTLATRFYKLSIP